MLIHSVFYLVKKHGKTANEDMNREQRTQAQVNTEEATACRRKMATCGEWGWGGDKGPTASHWKPLIGLGALELTRHCIPRSQWLPSKDAQAALLPGGTHDVPQEKGVLAPGGVQVQTKYLICDTNAGKLL